MPQSLRPSKLALHYIILVLAASLPFWVLTTGFYVFDDIPYVIYNFDLLAIESLADCFRFVLKFQPMKPVGSFFLGLAHWMGHGQLWVHRLFSIGLHVGSVLLLFGNARLLVQRLDLKISPQLLLLIPLCFAVLPVHSETIAVAMFRSEVLASFFSLAAALFAQKLAISPSPARYLLFSISLGLAVLSKEVFFFITPMIALGVYAAPGLRFERRTLIFLSTLVISLLLCTSYFVFSLLQDSSGNFHHKGAIGFGVSTFGQHLVLSARALAEGIIKMVAGLGLTTIRMSERIGPLHEVGVWGALAVFASAGIGIAVLSKMSLWLRVWSFWCLIGFVPYLVIPNINIGSEHYLYFSSMGTVGVLFYLGYLASTRMPNWARLIVPTVALFYIGGLTFLLVHRNRILTHPLGFYSAELRAHPEAPIAWIQMANAFLGEGPQYFAAAKKHNDEARRRLARSSMRDYDFSIEVNDYVYHLLTRDVTEASNVFEKLRLSPSLPKHGLARMYFDLGVLHLEEHQCQRAEVLLKNAIEVRPNPEYRRTLAKLKNLLKEHPEECDNAMAAKPADQTKTL